MNENIIGKRVVVVRQNFGHEFVGKSGVVKSIGKGVIPIHVMLDGDKIETDFALNELMIEEKCEICHEYLGQCECFRGMIK